MKRRHVQVMLLAFASPLVGEVGVEPWRHDGWGVGNAAAAAPNSGPPAGPSPSLLALLPDISADADIPAEPLRTTRDWEEALRNHRQHGRDLEVTRVAGPADATRVVVLVPQFHRSPLLPVLWSSLGEAIAGVQENIATVVEDAVSRHGVRCVGTEGSWSDHLPRSVELEELAQQVSDLKARADGVGRALGTLNPEAHEAARTVLRVLDPYVRRQLLTLDGVGVALAHRSTLGVARFGVEEQALNQKALALLARMRPLQEQLALLEPATQDAAEDEMGSIWRTEYAAFHDGVAQPLADALAVLDRARKSAMREGVELDADVTGQFVRSARLLVDGLLRPDEVAQYATYYARVTAEPEAEQRAPHVLSAGQRKKKARLESQLETLERQYNDVASRRREQAAVRRVLARLPREPGSACLLVMGANHEDALVQQLEKQGGGTVGVVVVQPWVEGTE